MFPFSIIKKLFSTPKFQILKSQDGQLYFILKARNGEIILTSEMYKNRQGVFKGIESVRKNSLQETNFEIRTSSDGKKYFVLKSGNRKIIGISEMYESIQGVKTGIAAVQTVSKTQKVEFV